MLSHIFALALALTTTLAASIHPRQGHPGDRLVRQIYQFPNETWVENLAVRSNGNILVTLVTAPEVWEVDPFAHPATAQLVYHFPDALNVLGIAEYSPDVFAVNVGNFSLSTGPVPGSWSVWSLDLRGRGRWRGGKGYKVRKITDVPEAKFLNGMTTLPAKPSTLLIADSGAGNVLRLDATTGSYGVAIDVPAMKPNTSTALPLGVNGVHFAPGQDGYLYFTNTFKRPAFSRVPVDADGSKAGPVEVILLAPANAGGAPDDFALDAAGNAWIADGAFDGLLKVDVAAKTAEIVVGGTDGSKVVGQTAAQFGRTRTDVARGRLYITNTGGIAVPPPRGIEGGAVWALDTALL